MTGSRGNRGAAFIAPAVSLGLLLLAWAATSGPVAVFSPSGRTRTIDTPTETPTVSVPPAGGPTLADVTRDVEQTRDLSWLGDLFAWAVLLALGLVLLAALRFAVRRRWRPPPRPPRVDFEVLPETRAAAALVEDSAARLTAVAEGSPRNGIVRCWARLEDSVAEVGLPRAPHETSAEFTVRVLHAMDLDPHAIGELARLYREARFSEHVLTEAARDDARTALVRLERDLTALHEAR